ALLANPADCAANQFAETIAANGDLSCLAIVDADVPNTITIDNATLAATVTTVDTEDATTFVTLVGDAAANQAVLTDEQLTFVANTGILTAAGFAGPLTGAVTGAASLNLLLTGGTLSGETGFSANPVIWSNTDITLQLDEDNNTTNSLIVNDGADGAVITIQEDGVIQHGATIDDDDCDTAGEWWYDTTDTAFEFCEAGAGVPTTFGGGGAGDKIEEGDSFVEVTDAGAGEVVIDVDDEDIEFKDGGADQIDIASNTRVDTITWTGA
ncbi:unnamed protein product, partial [marine sediment metagenome]